MRTTVELPDALVEELQEAAKREGTTVNALVEEGIRAALERRSPPRSQFKLRDGRSGTMKLRSEYEGNWPAIRDEIYKGQGLLPTGEPTAAP